MLLHVSSFEDAQGQRGTPKKRRLISTGEMHLGALELALTADNWSSGLTVRSAIDARIVDETLCEFTSGTTRRFELNDCSTRFKVVHPRRPCRPTTTQRKKDANAHRTQV